MVLVTWDEAFQLLEPVLDENELCRRRLVARTTFLDHQETLAVGRHVVGAKLGS